MQAVWVTVLQGDLEAGYKDDDYVSSELLPCLHIQYWPSVDLN